MELQIKKDLQKLFLATFSIINSSNNNTNNIYLN